MSDFKGQHVNGAVILWAVRWYCKYGISYRELADILDERGIQVNHTRVYRWVQNSMRLRLNAAYAGIGSQTGVPVGRLMKRTLRSKAGGCTSTEPSLKKAARRFLSKALRSVKSYHRPSRLNTDQDKA